MDEKVLITGSSGLIGKRLTKLLLQKGYQVCQLGRTAGGRDVPTFVWDPAKGTMDTAALSGVTTIIHLAGAGIADERWSEKRKKEIRDSRINSTRLLFNTLNKEKHTVKNFISASAIGYYGFEQNDFLFYEDGPSGSDFLASVVRDWEKEIDEIARLDIRSVKIRIGIVLSSEGGALPEMARPVRWCVGAPIGTGNQKMSWIHIHDLCQLFLFALENKTLTGAYNGVAPNPVTNREFTREIANILKKPMWLPPIPGFVIKLLVGEMAALVINGSIVSSRKVEDAGFIFQFPELKNALINLLAKKE